MLAAAGYVAAIIDTTVLLIAAAIYLIRRTSR